MKRIEELAQELKKECQKTNCTDCPFSNGKYFDCKLGIEVDGYDYIPSTWDI